MVMMLIFNIWCYLFWGWELILLGDVVFIFVLLIRVLRWFSWEMVVVVVFLLVRLMMKGEVLGSFDIMLLMVFWWCFFMMMWWLCFSLLVMVCLMLWVVLVMRIFLVLWLLCEIFDVVGVFIMLLYLFY